MAAEHQYFYEDEVYRVNKKGHIEFGMVLQNSELVSSDENSDNDDNGKMKKGHIRVAWHPTGAEEVVSERKVGLADRSLMPGDVVRRMIKGKDTQRGYCRHMEVSASIQIVGTKHIINNVKSKDLIPIEALAPDIAVCLDSWVGGIRLVHSKLHLSLPDNSRCVVTDPESTDFDTFYEKIDPDSEFRGEYYPGQVLWGPLSVLEEIAEWTQPSKDLKALKSKMKRVIKVTVEDVEIESVAVHWQCRAYSKDGAGSEKEQPKVLIQGDDIKRLKLLNVFEPCTLQVGDRNVFILKSTDDITTKEQWRKEQKRLILKEHSTPLRLKRKRTVNTNSTSYQKKDDVKKKEEDKIQGNENGFEEKGNHKEMNNIEITNLENSQFAKESSDCESETGSNASSSATSVVSNPSLKKTPSLPIRTLTKVLHKKKLRRATQKKALRPVSITPGSKVIVETVSTMSVADIVWQDGSVEIGIPSTELYPIHHLDDQEFFPGDFVIENREETCMRVYGVIQSVDHAGRTATVKWFKTYTSSENPQPALLMESEVSVYDLKDHPDFQYRPGTVVIRVANFKGEDEVCTAGQVLDNYPEGMVRVWWVEGHISMCWPQDLYKVGEYDSDEGELWDDGTSDDGSWQTESEDCCTCPEDNVEESNDETLKPKLAANIEKARIAMSRLEEIFTQNPSLQTTDVMRKLLEVYKDCRYLDKLMGTMFFHESHFQGLIERVRERGRTNLAQRVADQVHRLFTHNAGEEEKQNNVITVNNTQHAEEEVSVDNNFKRDVSGEFLTGSVASLEAKVTKAATGGGNEGICNSHVCVKLCSLLLAQLVKAHAEVIRRFGGSSGAMSEVNNVSPSNSANDNKEIDDDLKISSVVSLATPTKSVTEINGIIEESIPKEPESGTFTILDTAPNSHKYKLTLFQPTDTRVFFKRVREEIRLLKTSLPTGIWVAAFEDRMDLFSVMIRGPEKTPYEDGLFFFDFQLSADYPKAPPHCHYISYCSDRLNPNLYEDGKVCISLLGTWSGKGTEVWTSTSNLLQVIVSIQGLILVNEPYFNEAGYEKQKGSQQGKENSRMYNEMAVLKLVQSMSKLIINPPPVFKEEIAQHFAQHANKLCERLESWLDISENYNSNHPLSPTTPTTYKQLHNEGVPLPEFPLIPASKGFCLTLRKTLVYFKQVFSQQQQETKTS